MSVGSPQRKSTETPRALTPAAIRLAIDMLARPCSTIEIDGRVLLVGANSELQLGDALQFPRLQEALCDRSHSNRI